MQLVEPSVVELSGLAIDHAASITRLLHILQVSARLSCDLLQALRYTYMNNHTWGQRTRHCFDTTRAKMIEPDRTLPACM